MATRIGTYPCSRSCSRPRWSEISTALEASTRSGKITSNFPAIFVAIVLLGPAPAAVISVVTILAGWLRSRYALTFLPINLMTFAWFPLVSGIAFAAILEATGTTDTDGLFYLLMFAVFGLALVINYSLTNAHLSYVEQSSFLRRFRRTLIPVLPSELIAGLTAIGITYAYIRVGLATVVILILALIVLQYLIGALLISQQRADELELKAKQLAGFQVALLGALLRTLDLRDRMTARHSAAVARYSREIAKAAGLPEADQELVHTAGLLHDIGKFVLPDRILKGTPSSPSPTGRRSRSTPTRGRGSSPRSTATSRSARSSSLTTSESTGSAIPMARRGRDPAPGADHLGRRHL